MQNSVVVSLLHDYEDVLPINGVPNGVEFGCIRERRNF
jgi:hypothetical protein